MKIPTVEYHIALGDLHIPDVVNCDIKTKLENGNIFNPSKDQKALWAEFKRIYRIHLDQIGNDDFYTIINGDTLEGVHHKRNTLHTSHFADQMKLAIPVIEYLKAPKNCCGIWIIRGTPCHDGEGGENIERLAMEVKALKIGERYSQPYLNLKLGDKIINYKHFTSNSENGLNKEYRAVMKACYQDGTHIDMSVRSHIHQFARLHKGGWIGLVLPGWQLPTQYSINTIDGGLVKMEYGMTLISCEKNKLEVNNLNEIFEMA